MNNTLAEEIASFTPNDGNWLDLEELFEKAFSSTTPITYFSAIFRLFEQYPNDDGAGVFWSALHGMESVGGYEQELASSFHRCPSEMARAMLIRIRNSGESNIGGVPISNLLGKSE